MHPFISKNETTNRIFLTKEKYFKLVFYKKGLSYFIFLYICIRFLHRHTKQLTKSELTASNNI